VPATIVELLCGFSRERKPHRRIARCRKYHEDSFSAPPARSRQLPTGRGSVSSRGLLRIVSRLAGEHKLNLLFKTTRWSETANGCLVLDRTGTTAEGHERELRNLEEFVHALLRSASGEFLPS
jgi:hypothetical protein